MNSVMKHDRKLSDRIVILREPFPTRERRKGHAPVRASFTCDSLGRSNKEARIIGFKSFLDAFTAPEFVVDSQLAQCDFERIGSFENVGRYIFAAMNSSRQDLEDAVE